eukprot:scaffold320164_cov32-Tisochrysis_lutea.AAC.2
MTTNNDYALDGSDRRYGLHEPAHGLKTRGKDKKSRVLWSISSGCQIPPGECMEQIIPLASTAGWRSSESAPESCPPWPPHRLCRTSPRYKSPPPTRRRAIV